MNEEHLGGIYAYGFEKPFAIQLRAIRPTILGRDLIAQAQSGTGKAATFTIGTLAEPDAKHWECHSFLLAHTRELAQQIQTVVIALGDYMEMQVVGR